MSNDDSDLPELPPSRAESPAPTESEDPEDGEGKKNKKKAVFRELPTFDNLIDSGHVDGSEMVENKKGVLVKKWISDPTGVREKFIEEGDCFPDAIQFCPTFYKVDLLPDESEAADALLKEMNDHASLEDTYGDRPTKTARFWTRLPPGLAKPVQFSPDDVKTRRFQFSLPLSQGVTGVDVYKFAQAHGGKLILPLEPGAIQRARDLSKSDFNANTFHSLPLDIVVERAHNTTQSLFDLELCTPVTESGRRGLYKSISVPTGARSGGSNLRFASAEGEDAAREELVYKIDTVAYNNAERSRWAALDTECIDGGGDGDSDVITMSAKTNKTIVNPATGKETTVMEETYGIRTTSTPQNTAEFVVANYGYALIVESENQGRAKPYITVYGGGVERVIVPVATFKAVVAHYTALYRTDNFAFNQYALRIEATPRDVLALGANGARNPNTPAQLEVVLRVREIDYRQKKLSPEQLKSLYTALKGEHDDLMTVANQINESLQNKLDDALEKQLLEEEEAKKLLDLKKRVVQEADGMPIVATTEHQVKQYVAGWDQEDEDENVWHEPDSSSKPKRKKKIAGKVAGW